MLLGILLTLALAACRQNAPPAGRANGDSATGAAAPAQGQRGNGDGYNAPVKLADLQDRAIDESSGIAASRRNPALFWTHNDSGDGPFLYAFDRSGKRRGVWRVDGARARDWEDMASGPGPVIGATYIYVGDIGDNSERRNDIVVYRVREPLIRAEDSSSSNKSPRLTEPAQAIRLKYPDGKHDAEALLVHPKSGDLYIITKSLRGAAGVYKLAAPLPASGVTRLTRVGELRVSTLFGSLITGGDISPDGRRVALCDYFGAYELALPVRPAGGFDAIWKQPLIPVDLGSLRQGEAICYSADGRSLVATSEGLPCPLYEVVRRIESN